jgi:hypothetical protein
MRLTDVGVAAVGVVEECRGVTKMSVMAVLIARSWAAKSSQTAGLIALFLLLGTPWVESAAAVKGSLLVAAKILELLPKVAGRALSKRASSLSYRGQALPKRYDGPPRGERGYPNLCYSIVVPRPIPVGIVCH